MTSTGKINIRFLLPGNYCGRYNRYRITGQLAETRMSIIYQAIDTMSKRNVVIKFAENEAASQFLRNEAEILQEVRHPLFPDFHETAEWGGTPYIAMEYISGGTLGTILSREDIPFYRAIEIVMQICYGLNALHEAGYVHRDINPSNIILNDKTSPRLIDLGIAYKFSHQSLAADEEGFRGTLWYSSPEQFLGLPLRPKTDIFSMGVMLFETIKGENPLKLALAQTLQKSISRFMEADIIRELKRHANQPLPCFTRRDIERRIIPDEREGLADQIDRTFISFQQLFYKMTTDRPEKVSEIIPDLQRAHSEAERLASVELLDTKKFGVIDPRAITATVPQSK